MTAGNACEWNVLWPTCWLPDVVQTHPEAEAAFRLWAANYEVAGHPVILWILIAPKFLACVLLELVGKVIYGEELLGCKIFLLLLSCAIDVRVGLVDDLLTGLCWGTALFVALIDASLLLRSGPGNALREYQQLIASADWIRKRLPCADYQKIAIVYGHFHQVKMNCLTRTAIPDNLRPRKGLFEKIPHYSSSFLDRYDLDLLMNHKAQAVHVELALRVVFADGRDKLFRRKPDGTFNFDTSSTVSVLDGAKISTWYEQGETWGGKFGALSGAYEECRAEAVGYVLCCDEDILKIFGYKGKLGQQVKYVNWLSGIRAGLMALEFYDADEKKWGQAHCLARYVLLQVCLEAGPGFVVIQSIAGRDGQPDLKFKLDRTKIDSVGKPAVREFLKKLQHYKSTADFAGGKALFDHYGKIGDVELAWRDVCIGRRQFVLPNTILGPDRVVPLKKCAQTVEDVVESFVNRYIIDADNTTFDSPGFLLFLVRRPATQKLLCSLVNFIYFLENLESAE